MATDTKYQDFLVLPALAYGGLASIVEADFPGLHQKYLALGTAARNQDMNGFKTHARQVLIDLGFHESIISTALDALNGTNGSKILPAVGALNDNQFGGAPDYPSQGCTLRFKLIVAHARGLDGQ